MQSHISSVLDIQDMLAEQMGGMVLDYVLQKKDTMLSVPQESRYLTNPCKICESGLT